MMLCFLPEKHLIWLVLISRYHFLLCTGDTGYSSHLSHSMVFLDHQLWLAISAGSLCHLLLDAFNACNYSKSFSLCRSASALGISSTAVSLPASPPACCPALYGNQPSSSQECHMKLFSLGLSP